MMKRYLLLVIALFITQCLAENEHVHDTSSHCSEDGNSTTLSTDHKDLFPINGYDISSTFLVFVGSSFANAGGAGGGGIFVPLLILLTQFTPHGAIPLSKAMSTYTKKKRRVDTRTRLHENSLRRSAYLRKYYISKKTS